MYNIFFFIIIKKLIRKEKLIYLYYMELDKKLRDSIIKKVCKFFSKKISKKY